LVYSRREEGDGPSEESYSEAVFLGYAASGLKMESKLSSSTPFRYGCFSSFPFLLAGRASKSSSPISESFSCISVPSVYLGAITPSGCSDTGSLEFVDGGVLLGRGSGARRASVVSGCLEGAFEVCMKKSSRRKMSSPANTLSRLSVTFPRKALKKSSEDASLR
jgi:hypothetical protein